MVVWSVSAEGVMGGMTLRECVQLCGGRKGWGRRKENVNQLLYL